MEVVDGEDTDNTVVVQIELEDTPFQVGSAGLHGCTIVIIVSDKAVYMVSSTWNILVLVALEMNRLIIS